MRQFATIISFLFHPIFLPTTALLMVFGLDTYISQTTPFSKQVFIVFWIFVNTALIPLIFTLFLRWRGLVKSIQLDDREDRIVPFSFTLLFYLTNYYLMKDVALPPIIYSLFLGSTLSVGAALAFTFFTKISIHMIGMGGISATVYVLAMVNGMPITGIFIALLLLSGIVGSARIALDSHNLMQLCLGWGVGFLAVFLPGIMGWG